jgi:HAD superfamily hydrolase (TIGR01509 family)
MRAIIFDFDGVIADSEPMYTIADDAILRKRGHSYGPGLKEAMLGRSQRESLAAMKKMYGLGDDVETLLAERKQNMLAQFRENVPFYPDFLALLKLVRGRYRLAVATGSTPEMMKIVLARPEVNGVFEVVVSAEEVKRGKPAPDIYLEVARRMRVEPGECLVIEDAETGIASARAAGMKVVAVKREHNKHVDLSKADVVVDSLDEVIGAIEKVC